MILRDMLFTGWGHYNSIGALLTIIIPLPFFLTGKGRFASFGYFSAFVFFITLLFTCSRGSILFGVGIYIAGYVASLFHSRHARRQIIAHICLAILLVLGVVVFREKILYLFSDPLSSGFRSPERLEIYREGIKQFLRFPVLAVLSSR